MKRSANRCYRLSPTRMWPGCQLSGRSSSGSAASMSFPAQPAERPAAPPTRPGPAPAEHARSSARALTGPRSRGSRGERPPGGGPTPDAVRCCVSSGADHALARHRAGCARRGNVRTASVAQRPATGSSTHAASATAVISPPPGADVSASNHASVSTRVAVTAAVREQRSSRLISSRPVASRKQVSAASRPTQLADQCAARKVAGRVVASITSQGTITRAATTRALPFSCTSLAGWLLNSSFWNSPQSGRAVVHSSVGSRPELEPLPGTAVTDQDHV